MNGDVPQYCATHAQNGIFTCCSAEASVTPEHRVSEKKPVAAKSREYYMMAGIWMDEEVFQLIELWGDDAIQVQLEGCK